MSRKLLISLFSGTLINLALITLASATGTADGLPPSIEDVCSGETGAAYGLCNAYCQAMDCSSDTPLASVEACTKVSDKYQQIIGSELVCKSCSIYGNQNYPSFNYLVSTNKSIESCYTAGDPTYHGVYAANDADIFSSEIYAGVYVSGNSKIEDDSGTQDMPFLDDDDFNACVRLLNSAIARDLGHDPDCPPLF